MKKIGCFPLYPPLELFHSMDMLPVVLWGLGDSTKTLEKSDYHLQSYTCSIARRLTQYILSNAGKSLDGLFMYNACDTLRNLPEIMKSGLTDAGRPLPLFKIHVPMASGRQTDADDYLKKEIHSLVTDLENFFQIPFSADKFEKSIEAYNTMRGLANDVKNLSETGKMTFGEYAETMRKCFFIPVEAQIETLKSTIDNYEKKKEKIDKKRVILSGIMAPPLSVSMAIENAGLLVAGNDIAMLNRSYYNIIPGQKDPGKYYVNFYTKHHPCPTLLYSSENRVEMLLAMTREKEAAGVIFIGEKFCEYEYFEFPYFEKKLKEQGVQTLVLEITADDDENSESHRTRIEAFSEILSLP